MTHPKYYYTGDEKVPAVVKLGEMSTPVWIQKFWENGEYAVYIRANGCGHCCAAMALNLHGVKISPYEEYVLCRKRFGDPRGELGEENYHTVNGIVDIITSYGITAEKFGVPVGESMAAAEHIYRALEDGRQVIFWSHPSSKLEPNPFSSGEHYVIAVGLSEDGRIVVANSGVRGAVTTGVQYADVETIAKSLPEGCEPAEYTWGRPDLGHCGGYVIVG